MPENEPNGAIQPEGTVDPNAQPQADPNAQPQPGTPGATPPGQAGATPPGTPPGDQPPAGGPGAGTPGEVPDFIEKDGEKYYRSFDKHPDWRGLKDTSTEIKGVLEEHGYLDLNDLVSDLKQGRSLGELLGTMDANYVQGLLDKSQKWDNAESYWAEQKALELEKDEKPEDTVARLKNENKELQDALHSDREGYKKEQENSKNLAAFEQDLGNIVDLTDGLSDAEKGILKQHLGIDNPMDTVDIRDKMAYRTAAKNVIGNFSTFVQAVRQAAIDEYTKGQSKITPTPQPEGEQTPVVAESKIKVDENTSTEEAFEAANKKATELILQLAQGE